FRSDPHRRRGRLDLRQLHPAGVRPDAIGSKAPGFDRRSAPRFRGGSKGAPEPPRGRVCSGATRSRARYTLGAMPAAHPILRIRAPIVGRGEQVYELTASKVTIGRGEDCDIILLEQAASRAHAELRATEEGWLLVDLCSDNGVWVGGERVTRRRLDDGETFRIGETTLQLVLNPHAQPTIVEEGVRAPVVRPKPPFAPP